MELSQNDFDFLREFVRARSAIELGENKQYLVEARLQPIIHREGLTNYSELVDQLKQAAAGPLHEKVVDAMTTNEYILISCGDDSACDFSPSNVPK